MKKKGMYELTCHRCGRKFYSLHSNSLYCDMPSPWKEDKGRTCKQMRRIESKKVAETRDKRMQTEMESGRIVYSEKFGYLSRTEWMNHFYQYLREKYKFGQTYADTQTWIAENAEKVGKEYDAFQKACRLQTLKPKDFDQLLEKEDEKSMS